MPTVLITGANRGLGLEFVRQYLEKVTGRSSPVQDGERMHRTLAELSADEQLRICALDVTDHAQPSMRSPRNSPM